MSIQTCYFSVACQYLRQNYAEFISYFRCLENSPEITHQMFKGALYIISNERFHFFYKWKDFNKLAPALIK
jgi:hypothetical protein